MGIVGQIGGGAKCKWKCAVSKVQPGLYGLDESYPAQVTGLEDQPVVLKVDDETESLTWYQSVL